MISSTASKQTYSVVCATKPRDAWLAERMNGIGASEVAALLGIHPHKTAFEVYAEKTCLLPPSEPSREQEESMRWGLIHEENIARELASRISCDFEMGEHLLASTRIPGLRATPDCYMDFGSAGAVPAQLKCTNERNAWRWEKGAPEYVRIQNLAEQIVFGAQRGYAACLIGGNRLVYANVTMTDEEYDAIQVAVLEMQRRIEQRDPPEFVAVNERSLDLAKRLWPRTDGSATSLGEAWSTVAARWRQAQQLAARYEKEKKLCEAELRAAIGEHEVAVLPDGAVLTLREVNQPAKQISACSYRVLRYQEAK